MRPTMRLRILDYLRKQQTASVHDLSRALATTGANIRHHLAVLESNDLIEFVSLRREARGRPVNIYGLSRRVLGDGLDELTKAMVNVWLKDTTETACEAGLRSLALQLGGKNKPGHDVLLTQRLVRLIDRLNGLHYQARWEAGMSGPIIILGYCPYAAVVDEIPELCRMDAYLLEQWTGIQMEQTTKLQTGAKGYPICAFRATGDKWNDER
jgi:predicted ArsR family transcriptional regulator